MMCVDIGEDVRYTVSNDDIVDVMWAYPGSTDADHPPRYEGCVTEKVEPGQNWGGTNIDWEVTGAGDPDSSDSPETPDRTCTVPEGGASCTVYPFPTEGSQTVRAWIDFDHDDVTVEADMSEGYDEAAEPGDMAEPDATDATLFQWDRAEHDVETKTTIVFNEDTRTFRGAVRSQHPLCSEGRSVKLFKRRRDRERVLVDTVTTDDEGSWEVPGYRPRRGRFYAVAPPARFDDLVGEIECLRDRSRTIEID